MSKINFMRKHRGVKEERLKREVQVISLLNKNEVLGEAGGKEQDEKSGKGKDVKETKEGKLKEEDEIDGEEGWSRKTSERGEEGEGGGEERRNAAGKIVREGKEEDEEVRKVAGRRKREGWEEIMRRKGCSRNKLCLRERRRRKKEGGRSRISSEWGESREGRWHAAGNKLMRRRRRRKMGGGQPMIEVNEEEKDGWRSTNDWGKWGGERMMRSRAGKPMNRVIEEEKEW
jgi:hypothetical protein